MRFMKHADKFGLPIVTFVDTPGAFAGKSAEESGQASHLTDATQQGIIANRYIDWPTLINVRHCIDAIFLAASIAAPVALVLLQPTIPTIATLPCHALRPRLFGFLQTRH